MCIDCEEPIENPCSCPDGKHSWGVTSTSTSVTSTSFTMTMSTIGQYSGEWAAVNEHVFIQGYGYYKVTASTASTISVTEPASPFVGGAAFAANTVDFQAHGTSGNYTIPSGTKVTPAGLKGTTGATAVPAVIEAISHGAHETTSAIYTNLFTPFSLPAGSLNTDGDSLEIEAYFYTKTITGTSTSANVKILIGGISVTLNPITSLEPQLDSGAQPSMKIRLTVTRTSVTLASIRAEIQKFPKIGQGTYADEAVMGTYTPVMQIFEILNTGAITWANANDITFQGKVVSAGNQAVKCGFYSIKNLQQI